MEQAAQLATALQLTVKSLQFYTPEHPRVIEALAQLEQMCAPLLARHPRLTLTVAKGTLLVDGEPFLNPPPQVKTLSADLERRQLGGLIFLAGVTRRELLEVVRLLALRPEQIKAAGGPDEILKRAEVVHVRVSHVRYEAVTEGEEVVWAKSVRRVDGGDPALVLPPLLKSMIEGETADADDIRALLESMANNDEQLTLLRERLVELGITRDQFDDLLAMLTWDKLTLDERVEKLFDGNRIFDISPGKFQLFIRELLDAGRADDVHRLLERYVTGLTHDAAAVRQNVCDGMAQIVSMPLPREVEQVAGAAVLNHLVRASDAQAAEPAANFLTALVASGRSDPALRVIERLDATAPAATETLAHALGDPARASVIVDQVCAADTESLARNVLPLVTRLGAAIVPQMVDALGNEEDRNRRGRLVRALKTIGEPAYPFLVDALASPTWFVVRNALNVLGDIGNAALIEPIGRKLEHSDPRVRRAAARALGKIGGAEAERMLVSALNDRDAETQGEVLLCLGAMKAQSAIPGVAELARAGKVRELAVTTLGQIGSDAVVPVLIELLRTKSFFARDTPVIRIAAAKALATIKTPAAKDALRSAARAESDRATKAALEKLL